MSNKNNSNKRLVVGKIEQLTTNDKVIPEDYTKIKDMKISSNPVQAHFLQVLDRNGKPMTFAPPSVTYTSSMSFEERKALLRVERLQKKCNRLREKSLAANKLVKELTRDLYLKDRELQNAQIDIRFYKNRMEEFSKTVTKYNTLIQDITAIQKKRLTSTGASLPPITNKGE